jgi:hypothetical protein
LRVTHQHTLKRIRERIVNPCLSFRHKKKRAGFTRHRKLSFSDLVLFQLQKSLKSLQLRLNELSLGLIQMPHITKSAYSQARQKLRHTVFIELNEWLASSYYEFSGIKK